MKGDPIDVQIRILASRMSRFARDDRLEMFRDLEMVGWETYLNQVQRGKVEFFYQIKNAMQDYISLWQRGITWQDKGHRTPFPLFVDGGLEDWRCDSDEFSPERQLICREEVEAEVKKRDAWLRPSINKNKTECKQGHEFTEGNVYLNKKTGGRSCLTCRQLRNARTESLMKIKRKQIRQELKIIGVLNMELQREVANAVKYQRITGGDFGADSEAEGRKG